MCAERMWPLHMRMRVCAQIPAFRNRWAPTFSYQVVQPASAQRQEEAAQALLSRPELGVAGVRVDTRRGVIEVLAPAASRSLRGAVAAALESIGLRNQ